MCRQHHISLFPNPCQDIKGGDNLLATKIRALCRERNISISQLEEKADLKKNSIYDWDKSIPAVDKVMRVADCLGTSVEDLLKEEGA